MEKKDANRTKDEKGKGGGTRRTNPSHPLPQTPRQLYAHGGREGLIRLCKICGCEAEIARVVRAKESTVRKRLRQFGILRWPRASRRRRKSNL